MHQLNLAVVYLHVKVRVQKMESKYGINRSLLRHVWQPVCFRCYEAAKSYNNPLNPQMYAAVDLDEEGLPANSPRMKPLVPANEMEKNKMLDRDRYAPDPYRFAYNWREIQELTDR